jgi:PKD repeat protein
VHTYAEDGTYTVSLATSDGCSRSKEVSVEMLVSVFDEASGDGFSMVPNPASSWIRISAGSDGAKDADVLNFYNVSGQLVKTIQLQQGQTEWLIELSSFADGFYTASIHNEQGQSVYREKLLVLR